VCFRLRPAPGEGPNETNARNARLLGALNVSGELYLTHTVLPEMREDGTVGEGRYVLRMAIGGAQTRQEHVVEAWNAIRRLS
jgi:aromatic-L-amino-acid decarboxylase